MLKRLINECRLTLTLETKGPFIIKDGRYKKPEKGDPDSIPIFSGDIAEIGNNLNSIKNNVVAKCFIPGTSLRGVIRSYAEKIARTVRDEDKPICCDPFDTDIEPPSSKVSCSKRMDTNPPKDGEMPYSKSCVICKIFGCTTTASRIQIHDSVKTKTGYADARDGIGIDRFTGGNSSGAKFITLVLEGFNFENEIIIRNFELWQLGLLAYVFRDFENELITIGSGKSKGFGRVKGTISKAELTYYKDNPIQLKGIGELCNPIEAEAYGLINTPMIDVVNLGPPLIMSEWDSYLNKFSIDTNGGIVNSDFWRACAKAWNNAIPQFKTIGTLIAEGDAQDG